MGEGYPDYYFILEGITAELEKLYHSLWDRRKEELEIEVNYLKRRSNFLRGLVEAKTATLEVKGND